MQKLEKQLSSVTDEQDEIYRRRQIEWMKTTRMAVVVMSNSFAGSSTS